MLEILDLPDLLVLPGHQVIHSRVHRDYEVLRVRQGSEVIQVTITVNFVFDFIRQFRVTPFSDLAAYLQEILWSLHWLLFFQCDKLTSILCVLLQALNPHWSVLGTAEAAEPLNTVLDEPLVQHDVHSCNQWNVTNFRKQHVARFDEYVNPNFRMEVTARSEGKALVGVRSHVVFDS